MDDSCELKANGLQYYQEIIGVLRWIVELGRVKILLETSLMSSHLALPWLGHFKQLIHMFRYLKTHPKRNIAFDAAHTDADKRILKRYKWYNLYRGEK